jgi:osmotically-inducible protein OsmY
MHQALISIHRMDGSAETEELRSTPSEDAADLCLAASVDRALRAVRCLELRNLRISVDHGWITLRGSVRTYYLKQLAQATVMPVAGVESVNNQIDVA